MTKKHTIKYHQTDQLIPYAMNSRTHSDEQIAQIASSINEFGFTNPVLVDQNLVLIAGHGRVMAAKKLGLQSVPCIILNHLTEAQKKAYVIADNKIALNAGWNDSTLRLELGSLESMDFDLSLTGFDDDELDALLNIDEQQLKENEEGEERENTTQEVKFTVTATQYETIIKSLVKSKSDNNQIDFEGSEDGAAIALICAEWFALKAKSGK